MSAKTKIIVLRMKELIYTALFVGLVLFLILLFFFMFRSKPDETSVTTQGDANNAADAPIDPALIKGRVICHIDRVGDVVAFLKSPVGILIVLAAAIVLMEIPRRREKAEEEKARQQIIDEINQLKKQ